MSFTSGSHLKTFKTVPTEDGSSRIVLVTQKTDLDKSIVDMEMKDDLRQIRQGIELMNQYLAIIVGEEIK